MTIILKWNNLLSSAYILQLFKGKFFYCEGVDTKNIVNKSDCLQANYLWLRRPYNFDHLFQVRTDASLHLHQLVLHVWPWSCMEGLQTNRLYIQKIINNTRYRDPSNPLFIKNNSLKFHDIVDYEICQILYKAKSNRLLENIQEWF